MILFQWIPCHRRIDRSIKISNYTFPLCARCSGIVIGYLFLPLLFLQSHYLKWWLIPLLMIPLLIDGFTQKWKWRESNNSLRIITGILFGIAQCILIVKTVIFLLKYLS
ncbi:DUF2085 domain-containing protein [Gottfriedia solisilvae]